MSAYTTEYVFSGTAKPTTLASSATAGVDTSLTLVDATNWPSPTGGQLAIATLNYETNTEIKVTYSGRSGNVLSGVTWDYDGTTASGTYTADTTIRHSISAEIINDYDYVKRETVGKITAADRFLVSDGANSLAEKTTTEVATLLTEGIQDVVGAMFSSNTESGVTATYQDADGTIDLDVIAVSVVRKTADESVTNSTTLQDDDTLLVAIAANQLLVVDWTLVVSGSDAADIKVAVTVPAGAAGWAGARGPILSSSSLDESVRRQGSTTFGTAFSFGAVGGLEPWEISVRAVVQNGAVAGNVTLQWAQNTSNASATTVKAGSHLVAWEG